MLVEAEGMIDNEVKVLGRCGPAKYFRPATVLISQYPHDGSTALVADPGTENQQVYTVCLYDPPAPMRSGHVWLKGWGANEGAPEALEDAGLVKLTGMTWPAGFCMAQEAKLLNGGAEMSPAEPTKFGEVS